MATRRVKVCVQLQPQHCSYPQLRDACRRVEELGVDAIFTWDHFFPLRGDPQGPHFEGWTTLAAWAEQTSGIELGVLVSCVGYRNPQLLADMARTVDQISGGRVILGLGAGWAERDYTEYGYDFGSVTSRLDLLQNALPAIRSRLGKLNPPAVRPIPFLLGGSGERRTLRMVAEYADIWHTFAEGPELARKIEVLRRHCATAGRDPAEIEIAVGIGGLGRFGGLPQAPGVEGDPQLALGATMFTMNAVGPDFDLSHVHAWLAWRDELNAR